MVNLNNGPEAAYPGPADSTPETAEDHESGLEQTSSEPKQGTDERPEDWNPPPADPEADQDAQPDGEEGAVKTDSLIDSE